MTGFIPCNNNNTTIISFSFYHSFIFIYISFSIYEKKTETQARDRGPFGRIRCGLWALRIAEPSTWPAAGEPLSSPAASHPRVDLPPGGLGQKTTGQYQNRSIGMSFFSFLFKPYLNIYIVWRVFFLPVATFLSLPVKPTMGAPFTAIFPSFLCRFLVLFLFFSAAGGSPSYLSLSFLATLTKRCICRYIF